MHSVKARWKSGQIILDQPVDWPDDCEVLVELIAVPSEKIGIDDADWTDSPDSLADWDAWIRSVEPLDYTLEEDASWARFNEEMRRFNIEAVRRQMEAAPE